MGETDTAPSRIHITHPPQRESIRRLAHPVPHNMHLLHLELLHLLGVVHGRVPSKLGAQHGAQRDALGALWGKGNGRGRGWESRGVGNSHPSRPQLPTYLAGNVVDDPEAVPVQLGWVGAGE